MRVAKSCRSFKEDSLELQIRWNNLLTKRSQDPGFMRSISRKEFVMVCTNGPSTSPATASFIDGMRRIDKDGGGGILAAASSLV
nr:hypothetical protein Iba_chr14aCG11540 [Ipomoea batatas]